MPSWSICFVVVQDVKLRDVSSTQLDIIPGEQRMAQLYGIIARATKLGMKEIRWRAFAFRIIV
jgi:hypothetical protein